MSARRHSNIKILHLIFAVVVALISAAPFIFVIWLAERH